MLHFAPRAMATAIARDLPALPTTRMTDPHGNVAQETAR
jgi:hypothetical protein